MSKKYSVVEVKVVLRTGDLPVTKYKVNGQCPPVNYDTLEEAQCVAEELNALEPAPQSPAPSRGFSPF